MTAQKILHISAHALRGGCEKNCYYFIKSTPHLEHSVIVLGDVGPMVAEWELMGIPVTVLDLLEVNFFSFALRLRLELPKTIFQKIILWTNIRLPLVLFLLNRYKRAEVFVHIGNPLRRDFRSELQNTILSAMLPVRNRIHLRPVSEFVELSLKGNKYYSKFPDRVCLKPIHLNHERINRPFAVTNLSWIKLGMTARLDSIKDHKTVLYAMLQIRRTYPRVILYLIGEGQLHASLEELVASLGLAESVIFCGDMKNIYPIMKEWQLFIYATTRLEGLGGTVPEALSMGMPVVASALPMIKEWDKEGKFIRFCNPYDVEDLAAKVVALLDDIETRKFIFENAPDYISSHFSPHHFSSSFLGADTIKPFTNDQTKTRRAAFAPTLF